MPTNSWLAVSNVVFAVMDFRTFGAQAVNMFMSAGLKDSMSWRRSPCLCQQASLLAPFQGGVRAWAVFVVCVLYMQCSRLAVFVVYVLYMQLSAAPGLVASLSFAEEGLVFSNYVAVVIASQVAL